MRWSEISWTPTHRELRQFAAGWLGFLLLLAAWQGWGRQRPELAIVLAALALTVGPLGLLWPRVIRPVYVASMILAFPVGWLVTHLVLACLYYAMFTPIGLAFRLAGRDLLSLRRPADRESYWTVKPPVTDTRRYFRQF